MKHVILGAGGVGGLVGAALAHSGDEVSMVVRPDTARHYPTTLHVDSTFGTLEEPVEWSELVPEGDILWLTVKAPQLDEAIELIERYARPKTIVPLLNGVDHVARLRSTFGDQTVVPATIAVETERTAPGRIVHRSPFAKLNISSRGRDRLEGSMGKLRQLGFTGEFVDNEATLLWGKLVFLGPLALSTTAADKTVGQLVSDPSLWANVQACVREACAVGTAEGARLNVEVVIKAIMALPPGMRSSMQKDVEQGRAPEIDAIGGAIARAAARRHIPVPVTEGLIKAVEKRSQG